jgi:hypothetical protein
MVSAIGFLAHIDVLRQVCMSMGALKLLILACLRRAGLVCAWLLWVVI